MTMSRDPPKITMDPRWKAARTLVESGHSEGAIDMFATLVEETIARYSETSVDAAICYYEYGNALLRSHMMVDSNDAPKHGVVGTVVTQEIQPETVTQPQLDSIPAASKVEQTESEQQKQKQQQQQQFKTEEDDHPELKMARNQSEDYQLALEMMENAYSIFEEKASQQPKNEWIQYQLPRVLQGLGDILRELGRMADAADAYSRALPYREEFVDKFFSIGVTNSGDDNLTIDHLKNRRLLVEANILVAEALLGCEHGKHVVTSETKDTLVTADERVDYARGYYEKARDELQETVFLMGRIASSVPREELATEKENVCFTATLLMGVGETLAAFDEEQERMIQPPSKKVKTAS